MWKRLLSRLEAEPRNETTTRELACAVLLLECARADFEHTEVEIAAVRKDLSAHFGLAEQELERLIGDAGREARSAVSLHDYVAKLNRDMSPEDKRHLMAMLWRVAYADAHLDPHEEALLRKLADLLYIPQADFVREKLAASKGT